MAQQRREGARRADDRARVGERRARRRLRAADLEADDGLARLGGSASAAANAAGRRTVSTKRPIARVPSSAARSATKSARSRESSPPAETTVRKPTRGPAARNASAIEPGVRDAGDVARARTTRGRRRCRATARRRRASRRPCSSARRRRCRARRPAPRCAPRPRRRRRPPRRRGPAARRRARRPRRRPRTPPPRACARRGGTRTRASPAAPSARESTRVRAPPGGWG